MAQPGFRQFHLPAIIEPLAEHAVHIADAVAVGGDVEAGEAFHEASREPPEPAVAERRVGLQILDHRKIEAVGAQRLFHLARQPHVGERIAQKAADQEFKAEVIDPLAARLIGAVRGFHPLVDHLVAQREDGGGEPVVRGGGMDVLAHAVAEHIEDMGLHVGAGTAGCLVSLVEAHGTSLHLPGMARRGASCAALGPEWPVRCPASPGLTGLNLGEGCRPPQAIRSGEPCCGRNILQEYDCSCAAPFA